MIKLFTATIFTGNWLIFDNFQKISNFLYSFISQMILLIRENIISLNTIIEFFGKEITMNNELAFFMTTNIKFPYNPEIPNVYRSLFRSIAISFP